MSKTKNPLNDLHYQFGQPNEDTVLKKVKANVEFCGEKCETEGEVRLVLFPSPRINVYLEASFSVSSQIANWDDDNCKINVTFPEVTALNQGFISKRHGESIPMNPPPKTAKLFIVWTPSREPVQFLGDDSTEMSRVRFHLFNFVDFANLDETNASHEVASTPNGGYSAIWVLNLKDKDWIVQIKSLVSTIETAKTIQEKGGFGLTHIGEIKQKDNAKFTGEQVSEFLSALRLFLSFIQGNGIVLVCPIGFNSSNEVAWGRWDSPTQRRGVDIWFDRHHPGQAEKLFPCFMDTWRSNQNMKLLLHDGVDRFLWANNRFGGRNVDIGIIVAQSALEYIAYRYIVNERKMLTSDSFNKLKPSSEKFRLLFTTTGISCCIPEELPKLTAFAKKKNWGNDLPRVITGIRNRLVHPDKDDDEDEEASLINHECCDATLWLLELIILRLCGYNGTYSNRLKYRRVGKVENVPWRNENEN